MASEIIKELFLQYESYFQKRDFRSQAKLYSKDLMAAGPNGITHHANNFFTRLLFHRAMKSFYEKVHLTSVKIMSLEEEPITNEFSIVKVHWGSTFQITKDQLVEYDISYLVDKSKSNPQIVLFIAHEDEMKSLKNYGILTDPR